MKLYTIGFAGRTARDFFEALAMNGVRTLMDIRLKPDGQLAGFAKRRDLPFFLDRLANGCAYRNVPELAPTAEILAAYRSGKDWDAYTGCSAHGPRDSSDSSTERRPCRC